MYTEFCNSIHVRQYFTGEKWWAIVCFAISVVSICFELLPCEHMSCEQLSLNRLWYIAQRGHHRTVGCTCLVHDQRCWMRGGIIIKRNLPPMKYDWTSKQDHESRLWMTHAASEIETDSGIKENLRISECNQHSDIRTGVKVTVVIRTPAS